jgi:hypothetical protein
MIGADGSVSPAADTGFRVGDICSIPYEEQEQAPSLTSEHSEPLVAYADINRLSHKFTMAHACPRVRAVRL